VTVAHKIKAYDRKPSIQTTLGFAGSATVPVLAGATVNFIMRKKGTTGIPKVNSPATVVDAATAVIRYDWKAGDTDTPGDYEAEWEVVGADGLTQTFPTDAYDLVTVYADLDGAA
jgi:hypothetical protein